MGNFLSQEFVAHYLTVEIFQMQSTDVQNLTHTLTRKTIAISKYQTEHPADVCDAVVG